LRDPLNFSSETGGESPYGATIVRDLPVAGVMLNMIDDSSRSNPTAGAA
jgi:hypothetical protein